MNLHLFLERLSEAVLLIELWNFSKTLMCIYKFDVIV